MFGRYLHQHDGNPVRVTEPEFDKSPGFLLRFPLDRDASGFELGDGGIGTSEPPCAAISINDCPAKNTVPARYSRAMARPRPSR